MGTLARLGRLAPLLLIAAAAAPAADQGTGALDNRRHIHQRLRDRDDQAARELIECHLQRFPTDAVMLYNAACVECRLDAPHQAAGYLIRAIKAGFGMSATLLDGAVVESGAMVAAGALVTPGKRVLKGQLWGGTPAKYMRDLRAQELAAFDYVTEHYKTVSGKY